MSGRRSEEGSASSGRRSRSGGVGDPLWYDVAKSKQIPEVAREALKAGADLVFVWGGDGPACWPTRSTRSCSIRTPAPAGPAARRGF